MRRKAENIISACVIVGFSFVWIGVLVAYFYRNLFILSLVLGITIVLSGLIYGRYNQLQERKLGIEAEEQRREEEEISKQIDTAIQTPLPILPKIARIYGAVHLIFQVSLIIYGILYGKTIIHESFLERIVVVPIYVSAGMVYFIVGYLLIGGRFSRNAETHKLYFAKYAPLARVLMLIYGYVALFFGLCFASTLYRNNALFFKITTFTLIIFGLFTVIYFNLKSVKIIFKQRLSCLTR